VRSRSHLRLVREANPSTVTASVQSGSSKEIMISQSKDAIRAFLDRTGVVFLDHTPDPELRSRVEDIINSWDPQDQSRVCPQVEMALMLAEMAY